MFEIGYSLRAARERQGIGLPEAELATKIRAKYIRALEEEDFEALPADTYARGFLRTYADYLGLDGEIYVDEYASRFHNAEWDDEPTPARSRPRRPRRERTIERRAVVLALAGIAVVTALFFVAWKYGNVGSNVPGVGGNKQQSHSLVLRGVRHGTFIVVRRGSRSRPAPLQRHTRATAGRSRSPAARFYVSAQQAERASASRSSSGVIVLGG